MSESADSCVPVGDLHYDSDIEDYRRAVISLEEKNARLTAGLQQAREQLVSLRGQLASLSKPPTSFATFEKAFFEERQAQVLSNGRRLRVAVAANVTLADLQPGQQVRLDESLILVAPEGYGRSGEIAVISQLYGEDRVLVRTDSGNELLLELSWPLRKLVAGSADSGGGSAAGGSVAGGAAGGAGKVAPLEVGQSLLVDLRSGFALERIERGEVEQALAPEIPTISYAEIGGLGPEIEQIRDAIELPFKHPELYRSYGLQAPKGILLYGPPGCGKTLIAKAVAAALARGAGEAAEAGHAGEAGGQGAYFLSVKGPELLSKYVGETERQIRAIFDRARELATGEEGQGSKAVVVFFDEMEALFRTRGSGISSDVETMVVPQFLAEMDGLEKLDNVIIIGASNREDMIDPAVLRPGRLDVKIRISRPDAAGAAEILRIYLRPDLPYDAAEAAAAGGIEPLLAGHIAALVADIYNPVPSRALFEVSYQGGAQRTIYLQDMVSGAMLAAIVDHAKTRALKRALAASGNGAGSAAVDGGMPGGIRGEDLRAAVDFAVRQNLELGASTTPAEWGRILGDGTGRIESLRPISSR